MLLSLASDTIATIKARAARKLAIPDEGADIVLKYLWCDVFYTLDDGAFLSLSRDSRRLSGVSVKGLKTTHARRRRL